MNHYSQYAFEDGVTLFTQDTFNAIWQDLDLRMGTLEQASPTLNAAIADFQTVALDRINTALLPAFNTITQIQTLGFLSAPIQSGTNAVFAINASTAVQISLTQSQYFVPPPWVALVRAANATDYCIAKVLSYIPATGALALDITTQAGNSGTYTDVTVVGCPGGAIAAIDAYALIQTAVTTVNAALVTIAEDLATVAADTAYVAGVVLAGPVTSVDGATGTVVLGDEKSAHKGVASGYAGLDSNAHVPSAQLPIGLASGVAGLDGGGKVPSTMLPTSILGTFQYQGLWNAGTNSPALASGLGTQGQFYKVSVGGATVLDGNSVWLSGDYLFFDGTYWERINAPLGYVPVQQGTGGGQSAAFPIKIGWNSTTGLLTAYVTQGGSDVSLGNIWNDSQVANNQVGCRSGLNIGTPYRRQTVAFGPPIWWTNFLPATSGSPSITSQNISSSWPLVVTAANGSLPGGDLFGSSTSNLTWSWSSANANEELYLYVTVNPNGTLTTGVTGAAPIYQFGGVPSVANSQFTFNFNEMKMYVGNGSTYSQINAVFVGEVTTGGSGQVLISYQYAYNGYAETGWIAGLAPSATQTSFLANIGCVDVEVNYAILCNSADNGYPAGTVISANSFYTYGNADGAPTPWYNRLAVGYSGNGTGYGMFSSAYNFSSGALTDLTSAYWSHKLIAKRRW